MKIAVINKSTRVSNIDVEKMTEAVQIQLAAQVALLWEKLPPSVTFHLDESEVPEDASPILLFDDPDQADALGWHSEGPSGQFYGKVFAAPVLDSGGGVLDGGAAGVSVASVLSHEAAEMFIDESVNAWYDGPTLAAGSSYAAEVADPVEASCYPVTLADGSQVLVSNFVGPAWFDEMSPADSRRDWMGVTKAPFGMAPGGYMVVRNAPGSEREVFGESTPPAWRLKTKAHPASRTARRHGLSPSKFDDPAAP